MVGTARCFQNSRSTRLHQPISFAPAWRISGGVGLVYVSWPPSRARLVAKIDRLARNVRFLLTVVEGCGEGGVMFCELPALPVGPVGAFMLNQMAAVAALEAGLISERTKAALAAARVRGVKLGGWRGGPKVSSAVGVKAR